jgi:hypothetical protein
MHNRTLPLLAAILCTPAVAAADMTYPAGTTVAAAWQAPPRISAERAVELLSERFLHPRAPEEELDISDEDFEAFKFLIANRNQASEETSPTPGVRRFVGTIDENTALDSASQAFFDGLPPALAVRLGAPTFEPCVRQRNMVTAVKHVEDFGWTGVDVFGVAVFAVNLQYGYNNSDAVHGVYPFAYSLGYWDGLRCVLQNGTFDPSKVLRTCGRERRWMLQGYSYQHFVTMAVHEMPAVAQSSIPYLGALATGKGGTYQVHNQYHPSGDSTRLLGPSSTPTPSRVSAFLTSGAQPGINQQFLFNMIVSWDPNIILFAGFNNVGNVSGGTLVYDGHGEGNPHSIGDFHVYRDFNLYHSPLPSC